MTRAGAGGHGLARYVVAATLARTVDGGGVVAVVLLVTTSGGTDVTAGLLGACITFPHLLGPFIARSLDVARDGRAVLAVACVLHGATLAAAVLAYPHTWAVVPAMLLIVSGMLGPLLTGGISSRLPAIAGPNQVAQRRAQGWDIATYGIAGTVGPTIVALMSAWSTPTTAALVLAASAMVAALAVRLLPFAPPLRAASDVPRPIRTLQIIVRTGALRRTLYLTVVVALSVAVLPITAVATTDAMGVESAVAGALTAAYGFGGLAGAVGVMIRPLRGDADVVMPLLSVAVAVALGAVLVAPTVVTAGIAYAAAGVLNSYFFASTLAARSEYAPPAALGQVFVWVGALKITAGSAGTAMAGALISQGLHVPVVLGLLCTLVLAFTAIIDRVFTRRVESRGEA